MRSAIKPKVNLLSSQTQMQPNIPEQETHERIAKLRQKLYPKMFTKHTTSPDLQVNEFCLASEISIAQLSATHDSNSVSPIRNLREVDIIVSEPDIGSRKASILTQMQYPDMATFGVDSQRDTLCVLSDMRNSQREMTSPLVVNSTAVNFERGKAQTQMD